MNENKNIWSWTALPRLLYNHNPFYPISAVLMLYGIHRTAGTNVSLGSGALTMEMLCGYTALLALIAFAIARFGKVWDDARTILMIVALLLVALSAAFDRFLLAAPESGAAFLALGGLFALLITEGLLWSLRMRLATRYRMPYYLLLGLLFVYPYVLAKLSQAGPDDAMPWAMLLFPVLAAAALLTLWPAARFDDRHDRPNGTPWAWPLYPWSLFAVLFVAIELRSYSLGMTFEAGRGLASSFSSWFLTPLILAAAALLLELGLTAKNEAAKAIALAIPLACLPLAFCGANCPQSAHFDAVISDAVASPCQLALAAMAIFYLVAWLRGIPFGEFALVCCLAAAAMVDRRTLDGRVVAELNVLPLVVLTAIETLAAVRRRSSLRAMVAFTAAGLAAATVREFAQIFGAPPQYFAQVNPLVLLAVAAVMNDVFAKFVRAVAWFWLAAVAVWLTGDAIVHSSDLDTIQFAWLVGAILIGAAYWYRERAWPKLLAVMFSASALAAIAARRFGPALEDSVLGPGLPWLASGTAALWAAILVSLAKTGLLAHLIRNFCRFGDGRLRVQGEK